MREIKFRAWDLDNEQMYFKGDDFGTTHDYEPLLYKMQGQNVEVMQYTGLKDTNGIEIYEGDILGFDWVYQDGKEFSMGLTGLVQWIGGRFLVRHGYTQFDVSDINQATFERTWREQYRQGVPDEYFKLREIKVIGNIHENKELLS